MTIWVPILLSKASDSLTYYTFHISSIVQVFNTVEHTLEDEIKKS